VVKVPSDVHAVRVAEVSQAWQSFAGFRVPFATDVPPITQPSKQEPWKQTLFWHAFPQAPQFALSVAVSTHPPFCGQHACVGPSHAWPVHSPPWQVSVNVHASPSLHDVPSGSSGSTH
jgi:hypothetical protein